MHVIILELVNSVTYKYTITLNLSLSLSLSPLSLSLSISHTFLLSLPLSSSTARSYQPLNFLLTQNAVIGVGAVLGGALLITILVLGIGLLVYFIRQHRVKMGKHETLLEEEEYEKRQRRRDKRRKVYIIPKLFFHLCYTRIYARKQHVMQLD